MQPKYFPRPLSPSYDETLEKTPFMCVCFNYANNSRFPTVAHPFSKTVLGSRSTAFPLRETREELTLGTTWGLGALIVHRVENLCKTYRRSSVSVDSINVILGLCKTVVFILEKTDA